MTFCSTPTGKKQVRYHSNANFIQKTNNSLSPALSGNKRELLRILFMGAHFHLKCSACQHHIVRREMTCCTEFFEKYLYHGPLKCHKHHIRKVNPEATTTYCNRPFLKQPFNRNCYSAKKDLLSRAESLPQCSTIEKTANAIRTNFARAEAQPASLTTTVSF